MFQNQGSCIINGGKTMRYFPLKRRTRRGNPMSVYLFTLVLEIVFIFMKESENSQGLIILIISFYTPQGIHFSYNRSLENMRTIGDIS